MTVRELISELEKQPDHLTIDIDCLKCGSVNVDCIELEEIRSGRFVVTINVSCGG
jgi:hypothetical protein